MTLIIFYTAPVAKVLWKNGTPKVEFKATIMEGNVASTSGGAIFWSPSGGLGWGTDKIGMLLATGERVRKLARGKAR